MGKGNKSFAHFLSKIYEKTGGMRGSITPV